MHRLTPHPDFPPAAVAAVGVELDRMHGTWSLAWSVTGAAALALPPPAEPVRSDGLWQATCFELFVMPAGGPAYFEFNLSPSTQWAAYAFDGHRAGMRDWPMPAPRVERTAAGVNATLDLAGLPSGKWRAGLSAVIVEQDGTRSFWALAHPPGAPDFHHRDCFVLELPPAG